MNNIFKSRTVWTIVVMFLVGGITSIREFIPTGFLPLIEGALGILAIYFRIKQKVNFEKVG